MYSRPLSVTLYLSFSLSHSCVQQHCFHLENICVSGLERSIKLSNFHSSEHEPLNFYKKTNCCSNEKKNSRVSGYTYEVGTM